MKTIKGTFGPKQGVIFSSHYQVADEKGTFAEAQMGCMPEGEVRPASMYDQRMMFSEKRHVLTHVLQKVEAKHGESRYWLGLDLR